MRIFQQNDVKTVLFFETVGELLYCKQFLDNLILRMQKGTLVKISDIEEREELKNHMRNNNVDILDSD